MKFDFANRMKKKYYFFYFLDFTKKFYLEMRTKKQTPAISC